METEQGFGTHHSADYVSLLALPIGCGELVNSASTLVQNSHDRFGGLGQHPLVSFSTTGTSEYPLNPLHTKHKISTLSIFSSVLLPFTR